MKEVWEQIESIAIWEGIELVCMYEHENTVLYVYGTEESFETVSVPGYECIGYSIIEFANKIYQSDCFVYSMLEYGNCIKRVDFPYLDYFHETASQKEHWKKASGFFSSMKRAKTWDVKKAKELLWHVESLEWISITHKPSPLTLKDLLEIQMDAELSKRILEIEKAPGKRTEADPLIADYVDMQLQAYRYRLQNVRIARKNKTELVKWVSTYRKEI